MINTKIIIKILLKKDFIKKELQFKNKKCYYYNIPNSRKIIKSNKKIQKINSMLIGNFLLIDANLYNKIKNKKDYKTLNKYRNHKILNNKGNMLSTQSIKPCDINSQNKIKTKVNINSNNLETTKMNTIENISDIKNEKKFHFRSKSVTFVKDSLEQIRLFNTFDPPNNINFTPTHYSTGKINSDSLLKFQKNRNHELGILPFTNTELKESALYDHPVRRNRSNSKCNKPYNLKMDFSFGNSLSISKLSSPTSNSISTVKSISLPSLNSNSDSCSEKMSSLSASGHQRSSIILNNFCYTSSEIENPINYVNNNKGLYSPSSIFSLTKNKIASIPQLV